MQSMRPSSVPRADRADDGHAGAGGGHKRLSEGDADRLTPHLHGGCRGRMTVAESFAVSMGGCIASALMDASAVEVVDAVLGTVSSRPRGALAAVATR